MTSFPLGITHVNADNSPVHVTVLLSDLNTLFDLIAIPVSLLLHFIPLCGALVVLVLALSSYLGCLALLIFVYGCLSCPLRVLYVVALVYFAFVSWFFPPKSLPGDDVLCRLLPHPLPSVRFLPCLFVLFIYLFILFYFPTVFVPDLFCCNFLYLVTTAGFVADQLIM